MKKYYDLYWEKLDNVGTFYASTTSTYNPNIYRISVKLKEKVKKEVLEEALSDTLLALPSFNVKLRKGLFWYYLEQNSDTPIVSEDEHLPFKSLNNFNNNYFLFKVTYFEKRISIDFSHILTDGTGALHFITVLVTNYMKIKHPKNVKQDIVTQAELLPKKEMSVDSFIKYSKLKKEEKEILKERTTRSYMLEGERRGKENSSVIIGTLSVRQLKAITKVKNTTITSYLAAVLIYSIYQSNFKYTKSKDPIVICIPVNLRNYFPSYSMNNFFSTIMISVDVSKKDYSFEEILDIITNKIKKELNKSVLLDKFKFFAGLQQNIVLRFIPLVVKDILLKGISNIVSEHGATTTLSNLGAISVNDDVKDYIDKFDIITYTDNSLPVKVGMCSFEDKLSITFSSFLTNTEIERSFFTYLESVGLDIRISASETEHEVGNEIL